MRKIYYYKDPLNDDFAGNKIKRKELDENYNYISRNPFRIAFDFVFHHFIVTPIVFLYQKIRYSEKTVNRKVVKPYLKSGFYLYGNHTRSAGDAFTPHLITFPRKAYIIINPDGVSIPFVRHLVKSLGGFPLPTKLAGMKNFRSSLMKRSEKNCIMIYPEAHIWPCYTKIRPFKDVSFKYPIDANKPVFCCTTTYKKKRISPYPKTVVYIDGPFFPDPEKSVKENQRFLRNQVYSAMIARSKNSDYEYHKYIDVRAEAKNEPY